MAERLSEIARRGSGDLPPPQVPPIIKFAPLPPPPEEEVEAVVEAVVGAVVVESSVEVEIPKEETEVAVDSSEEISTGEVEPTLEEIEKEMQVAGVEEIEEEESSFI